jgi:FtsH-binding integral membrane protein
MIENKTSHQVKLALEKEITMKKIKWPLLAFAFAAAICIGAVGIAIGERSILGIFACIALLFVVMGFGFKTKKKMREKGLL